MRYLKWFSLVPVFIGIALWLRPVPPPRDSFHEEASEPVSEGERAPMQERMTTHLRSRDTWSRAIAAAYFAHHAAPPELLDDLRHLLTADHPMTRSDAVQALGNMGKTARAALPDLLPLLSNGDTPQRIAVAEAMVRIDGAQIPMVLPVLESTLTESDDAWRVMMNLGPAALPTLLRLFEKSDAGLRVRLLDSWAQIGTPARSLLPQVRAQIASATMDVQLAYWHTWMRLDPANEAEALAQWPTFTRSEDDYIRWQAIDRLASVAPKSLAAREMLATFIHDRQAAVVLACVRGLAECGPSVRHLLRLQWGSPNPRIVWQACQPWCHDQGASSSEIVPVLTALIREPSDVQVLAADQLFRFDPSQLPTITARLRHTMNQRSPIRRIAAAGWLLQHQPDSHDEALAVLQQQIDRGRLRDDAGEQQATGDAIDLAVAHLDESGVQSALESILSGRGTRPAFALLHALGSRPLSEARPWLFRLSAHADERIRHATWSAMARRGIEPSSPITEAGVAGQSYEAWRADLTAKPIDAMRQLQGCDPEALAPLVPQLLGCLQHRDDAIAIAAVRCLGALHPLPLEAGNALEARLPGASATVKIALIEVLVRQHPDRAAEWVSKTE